MNRTLFQWIAGAGLGLALGLGCASAGAHYDYSKEVDPRKHEFVIGVSDHLRITVWKNPDLSGEVIVRPDGTITLPLIGDLTASNRTPAELRAEIIEKLAKFVKDESAVVTVAVTEVKSYTFTVSGNVERPGVVTSDKYVTVLEAVQLAGGLNRFASPGDTVLLRPDGKGDMRRIPIDYPAVQDGRRPEANLALLPGDIVYVP